MGTLEKKIRNKNTVNSSDYSLDLIKKDDAILCSHCLRTASNGIRCMGICVADNDY